MAQPSSSRNRRFGLAALALAAILPSGPAAAQPGPQDMHQAQSPALVLAQASIPDASPVGSHIEDILDLSASVVSKGGRYHTDGAIIIRGDIVGSGVPIHISAEQIEVIGSVTGSNITLDARTPYDQQFQNVRMIDDHRGRVIIQGDVDVTDSRIGTFGTGNVTINGHARITAERRDPGRVPFGTAITGRNICIAGSLHTEAAGDARNFVSANELRIGRDVTGNGLSANIYDLDEVMDYARANGGRMPAVSGSTLIGGAVQGRDMTIGNGEVSIRGGASGPNIRIHQQRNPLPITNDDLNCAQPASLSELPAERKPAQPRSFG
jgi:hypothetical protein